LIGLLNLGVSFYLAFRLALRAHNVSGVDRHRIRQAIRMRLRQRWSSFLWPAPEPASAPDKETQGG
jgi:site-specific recombinase